MVTRNGKVKKGTIEEWTFMVTSMEALETIRQMGPLLIMKRINLVEV